MPKSIICLDASIVISLVTSETQSKEVLNLWTKWVHDDLYIVAPSLLAYEVTSALRRKVVQKIMSHDDARISLEEALSLGIDLLNPPNLSIRAFDIALHVDRPNTYDAHYLALAEMLDCDFWTVDEKFYNAVKGNFVNIRCLSNTQK